ncbi:MULTISPECIES: NfeD family protein [unclassified Clostridioides]|uniref:NfeD family protein n=1 Tax=unclassified Clostridioides TaxID=2635829 RepID=UPI001D101AD5|nr:NfeD family protein [Clostridioides sp. ZZV14-6150]MCC0662126.1 NfeD family protein [Clostridioides sp. ZZV14-6154]MCC0669915.1 NfeD family protein [Clostridioides sp. ZZV14-6153]MCC0719817.1 NfeD family protein [Clostridioides sp. ZZV14-6105]MCC0722113.1 NfeD family protein [Clostridioides sp. ZZV14-6104]MCC0728926.1 NfeD family protein [Clostridioides sp. ZZV14-6045]MCC0732232.1 NfeD family protein [Clostridioides sp. ZZV14-6048]MCC0736323.1 NfeD family protein [Clostridioides sp. ZZV14
MKLIWLIVAILFGIAEMLTPSLTLIWFSVGAVILIFLSTFIKSIFLQVLIFAVISIAMLVVATKKIVKKDKTYKSNTNLQAMISKKGVVTEEISPNQTGLVVVEHETWTAISIDDEKIDKGSTVEVLKIEGVKLVVKKVNSATSVTNQ